MTLSTSPNAYPDCFTFCEKCLDDSVGARRAFKTESEAVRFRVRCNYFRKLSRRQNAELYEPDDKRHGTSDYDVISFTVREGPDGWWWVYGRKLSENEEDIESLSEVEPANDDETSA